MDEHAAANERLVLWQRCVETADAATRAAAFSASSAARLRAAGGDLIAQLGASVVSAFDTMELEATLPLALEVLAEAQQAAGLEVACGLALGPQAEALDRAQLLANRAAAGELVLDGAAHQLAESRYLFSRTLRAGSILGEVVDARFPARSACRSALSRLRAAPLPPGTRRSFSLLRQLLETAHVARIALRRSHAHSALEWVERLSGELEPPLLLHISRRAAGLQPLGALALALWRARAQITRLQAASDALGHLARGAPVTRAEAAFALRALLQAVAAAGRPAWLVLDRLHELDAPSLAVVADVLKDPAVPGVVLMTLSPEEAIPSALLRSGTAEEVTIEPLAPDDRRFVAAHVLGLPEDSEVARRVALLGGDSCLGILEAARTLVSAGDLVHAEGAFRWRTLPRRSGLAIPTEALLTERMAHLEVDEHRVLEAMCVAAKGAGRSSVEQLSARDGMDAASIARGFERLAREGWLDSRGELGPMQALVRGAMRNGMPSARAAELHRFAADVLSSELPSDAAFGRGLLAHHLAQGGQENEAAQAVLDVARAAAEHGFARMAVRLAAYALKLDEGPEVRRRARALARNVDSKPQLRTGEGEPAGSAVRAPAEEPETADAGERRIASTAIRAAIRALCQGDPEAADGFIDTAVAAGWGRGGAQRLSAVARLARGDITGAVRKLQQAQRDPKDRLARTREAITGALILLESGDAVDAIRSALSALAAARGAGDQPGETAALLVLSACYRALGRDEDAERLSARPSLDPL